MASAVNGSFASPLAHADLPVLPDGGLLSQMYSGMSGLSVFVTFLLILVAYDQCMLMASAVAFRPTFANSISYVHMEQRVDRRACVEDAIRWTFPILCVPEDGRV